MAERDDDDIPSDAVPVTPAPVTSSPSSTGLVAEDEDVDDDG